MTPHGGATPGMWDASSAPWYEKRGHRRHRGGWPSCLCLSLTASATLQVNGNEDNGVLEGKWSEDFAHHENPSRWDGSVAILRKWAQCNFRPVQYGQCWVFAGVAGTGT